MTAKELLAKQIDDVSYQLGKVLEGTTEADADFKAVPSAMSLRETLEHMSECYVAAEKMSRGEDHEWGSFSVEDKSLDNLKAQAHSLRSKAVSAVLSDEDNALILGAGFIVAHDNYHVGQLCTIRIAHDAEWDAYSIYPS